MAASLAAAWELEFFPSSKPLVEAPAGLVSGVAVFGT